MDSTGLVHIRREQGGSVHRRRWNVVLDNQVIDYLDAGATRSIVVTAGTHKLQLETEPWPYTATSNAVWFRAEGETVTFSCGTDMTWRRLIADHQADLWLAAAIGPFDPPSRARRIAHGELWLREVDRKPGEPTGPDQADIRSAPVKLMDAVKGRD